jgi:Ca2+/H+ antiporter, TMEM165/GDT1 family
VAGWMLIPDHLDDESGSIKKWQKLGVFFQDFQQLFSLLRKENSRAKS